MCATLCAMALLGCVASDAVGTTNSQVVANCSDRKDIRILSNVSPLPTPIQVQYDALDPLAERIGDTGLPTLELSVGDTLDIDPGGSMPERVTVIGVSTIADNSGVAHRTFTAMFIFTHNANVPATAFAGTPCSSFVMPMQDVCDETTPLRDLFPSCWQETCDRGEIRIVPRKEGLMCGSLTPEPRDGKCDAFGVCQLNWN
jgi:hypothetical protein